MRDKIVSWEMVSCLIVDDDKFSRNFMKTALYQIGIKNVREASDVDEAKLLLSDGLVDVILLDQQMPGESGLEFARELKRDALGNTKDIPIIMVTIDAKESTVLDARDLGIHEYLVKPISPLSLKKRLCSAFGIKQERV